MIAVHYIWYDKLYFKEDNAKKKTRLLHRLEKGKPEPNLYILALPEAIYLIYTAHLSLCSLTIRTAANTLSE